MSMASTPANAGRSDSLVSRQTGRVDRMLRGERQDGLKLALQLRVAVMLVVGAYLLSLGWTWDQWINLGALAGLSLTGWLQYRVAGSGLDRAPVMALFPVADACLVVFGVFGHMGFEPEVTRLIMEEERPFSWFMLLLVMQSLAHRSWLAVWAGFVTAIVWIAVMAWMLSEPGAHTTLNMGEVPPGRDPIKLFLAAYYDPFFLNAEVWIREALIAILCGMMLAVAVYRSQGMLGRAVQAERSRANLARYFSPTMVDELAGNDRPFEGARKQDIGVLFADIVGFTRLAEKATPGELIELLREFHSRVADVVFRHGGTLDKFIGDCVMATFGTPLPAPGDATRTIFCATRIAETVAAWNTERIAASLQPIEVGIGAHFGSAVLGDIGDERRLEFAVLGDTVNVASRLEGLTRGLSRTILISDDLVQAARKEGYTVGPLLLRFAELPSQQLRNRDQPVSVWGSAVSAGGSDLKNEAQRSA